jgi:hypothetical protein
MALGPLRLLDLRLPLAEAIPSTWNPVVSSNVSRVSAQPSGGMSVLKRLLGMSSEPSKQRIRICIECGMPIAEHKDWCSILRGQLEMQLKAEDRARPRPD